MNNVEERGIPGQITDALTRSVWSQFNSGIIRPHDNGHLATGETLAQQGVAAYDPIFWFFHANLDRLWWKWQQTLSATTLNGFLSTVMGSTDWLRTPPFNRLPPFSETADQPIDLTARGIDYEHPAAEAPSDVLSEAFGSLPVGALRNLHSARKVGVRVKAIDRLNIPGSFMVHLQADGATIASQRFFQARNPRACSACVKQGKVDIDLEVDIDQLRGGCLLASSSNPCGQTPSALLSRFSLPAIRRSICDFCWSRRSTLIVRRLELGTSQALAQQTLHPTPSRRKVGLRSKTLGAVSGELGVGRRELCTSQISRPSKSEIS
jgi:hypothetical protein